MCGWLYLIRNGDLYKIGITKDFETRMRQLKPDNVVAKLYTKNFVKLERELHNRYKRYRIPQTEYFRLKNSHIKEISQRISTLDHFGRLILEIFTKSALFIILLFFLIFLFLFLNINEINTIILKSVILMERILFAYSFLSLFLYSGKYLSFLNELQYRLSRLATFIILSLFFRIVSLLLQSIY